MTQDSDESKALPQLGEYLRAEREKKQIALEQVAAATKVNLKILENIEEGRFSELPAKPFLKGFVSAYAKFIGLKPQEIWNRFGDQINQCYSDRPDREAAFSGYAFEKRDGDGGRRNLWIVMVSFVVVGAIGYALLKPALKRRHRHAAESLGAVAENAIPAPVGSPVSVLESPVPINSMGAPLAGAVPVSPVAAVAPVPVASPTITAPAKVEIAAAVPAPVASVDVVPVTEALTQVGTSASATHVPTDRLLGPIVLSIAGSGESSKGAPSPHPSEKPDPLFSGVNLKPEQIRVKVLITALEDTYVKYRVDERSKNQLSLRQGRVLVLRAEKRALFQASEPGHISVKVNGVEYSTLDAYPGLKINGSVKTGVAPAQVSVNIEEMLGSSPPPIAPPPNGRRASE